MAVSYTHLDVYKRQRPHSLEAVEKSWDVGIVFKKNPHEKPSDEVKLN